MIIEHFALQHFLQYSNDPGFLLLKKNPIILTVPSDPEGVFHLTPSVG